LYPYAIDVGRSFVDFGPDSRIGVENVNYRTKAALKGQSREKCPHQIKGLANQEAGED